MSEEKKSRTIADVQSDYQAMCTRAGHINYQVFALKKDLEQLNNSLRDLNLEASTIQKAESEKAPATEEAKS